MVKLKVEVSKSICYYSENTRLKGILGPIEQLCDFFKNVYIILIISFLFNSRPVSILEIVMFLYCGPAVCRLTNNDGQILQILPEFSTLIKCL